MRTLEGRPRSLRIASWGLGVVAVLAVILLLLLFMKERRPDSASRETTTTRAEIAADSGVEVTGAVGPACARHANCSDSALCTRGRCVEITSATTECRDAMVRFARWATELSTSAENEVDRAARCMKANRDPTLAIEPSRDPTLPPERNAELTEARRSTVIRALEQRGVPRERLNAMGL